MKEIRFDRLDPQVKVKALRNLKSQIIYDFENGEQSELYKQLPTASQVSFIDKRIREVLFSCRFTSDGELSTTWKIPIINPNLGVLNE
jgi:hypothetical protein